MTEQEAQEAATHCAEQIAKYGFMVVFALGFPKDEALIHHNLENLNAFVKELNEIVKFKKE